MQIEPQIKLFAKADQAKKSLKTLHKPSRTNLMTEERRSNVRGDSSTNKSIGKSGSLDNRQDHRLQFMMSNLGH